LSGDLKEQKIGVVGWIGLQLTRGEDDEPSHHHRKKTSLADTWVVSMTLDDLINEV
jgi:hypothetical protein